MEVLQAGSRYSVSTEDKNNKSVIFVKLTDSALQSIETFLNTKDVSSTAPTIQFQDNSGVISLPSNGKKHNYGFTLSNIEGDKQSGFQCLQRIDNSSLESLGFILKKMQIHATEDSYEKTKCKMTAAEQEQKNLCTRELRLSLPRLELSDSAKHTGLVYVPELPQPNITNPEPKQSSLKARTACSAPLLQQPIRERIIQILAAKEYKKAELLLRLKREGISDKDKNRINVILEEVAHLKKNSLLLDDYLWDTVQEDWQFYSKEELQIVKKKKQQFLKSKAVNGTAGLTISPAKQKNGSSSALEIYTKICNQKQNTFYDVAQNDNTDQNESSVPNNNALTNGSATPKKDSFHFNCLNGNFRNPNVRKRGRPRIKKDVIEIDDNYLVNNGTSKVQKTKCSVIPNIPSLQASFVSEELRNERVYIKSEENTCSETISNGNGIYVDENRTSSLMSPNSVKKPRKRSIVPNTEADQLNNCVDTNNSRRRNSQYIFDKLQQYKQMLLEYSPPLYHSITLNCTNNSGNVSEIVPVAQTVPEYNFSEITCKYSKVELRQQRGQYCKDFYHEYGEYLRLRFEMQEISEKFSDLHDRLQAFAEGSPEYKRIKFEIGQEYKRAHNTSSYFTSRKKFDFLKAKLLHIKQLIEAYDREKTSEL